MGGGQNQTPRGWQADTGQVNRYAKAAGTSKLAQAKGRAKRACLYQVQPEIGDPFSIQVTSREAWALDRLREAGARGCTPRTEPAPRWSAYVHNLRERGVGIETIYEPHGSEFSGTHGRYVLRCEVRKGGAA
jgi:hypothetical protein